MKRIVFGALFCSSLLLADANSYIVKKGDSLSRIAKNHNTTVDAICAMNQISKNSTLRIGQKLKIGSGSTNASTARIAGDSQGGIIHAVIDNSSLQNALSTLGSKSQPIDTKSFTSKDIKFVSNPKLAKLPKVAKSKIGTRYVWGGTTPAGFDCSGLTFYACRLNGINIPRTSIEQSKTGVPVPRNALQPGDLVFFDTSKERRGYVNHVGIYMGDGKFIHASSAKKKVVITSLNSPFYSSRFKGARRVN
ncbi:MAG TPA: peptidoglycan endopeptidase [Epsilonproteobacteria bacterium]|nr:peptidoglycan endopeptidase [Campylobacterota bacterium]